MTRASKIIIRAAVAAVVITAGIAPAWCQMTGIAPSSAARETAAIPLVNTLDDAAAWRQYKARFISEQGRVIDTANGGISHSEGQGYGMLLAVAAGDHAAFDTIWGWTRANLMVRGDELMAWRWEPDQRPAIADMNDASDGDLLVAWALTEASEAWHDSAYKAAARRIAVDIGRKVIIQRSAHGAILLPGASGFAHEDRPDGPVINLSYWVFPAFARLPLVAPEVDWAGLSRNGLELVKQVRFGPAQLPTEWVSLSGGSPSPAGGFPKVFSYNAIRVPLYIAWAGLGQREIYKPFVVVWQAAGTHNLPIVDASTGRATEWLGDKGYGAIAALTACAAGTNVAPVSHTIRMEESYYAVTLNLLALVAGHMRYPACFDR